MNRYFESLRPGDRSLIDSVPGGLFLVRIKRVNYRWHTQRPLYEFQFVVLDPRHVKGCFLKARLYCTARAMWKLHWLLRVGVVGCLIGHGAYGVLTKEAWVPYFGVAGIDRAWAYRLMPWIGLADMSLGLLMAIMPLPIGLLHLTVWGLWTAALRPLSGDSVWELVERAGL